MLGENPSTNIKKSLKIVKQKRVFTIKCFKENVDPKNLHKKAAKKSEVIQKVPKPDLLNIFDIHNTKIKVRWNKCALLLPYSILHHFIPIIK